MATFPQIDVEEEKYLAFTGLIQWTHATVLQGHRIAIADSNLRAIMDARSMDHTTRLLAMLEINTADHLFASCAHKLFEHKDWAQSNGLFQTVDFTEIDSFSQKDIRDLRNMREHQVEYYLGNGNAKSRWITETPEWSMDASSRIDTVIGGKLDYVMFTNAADRLRNQLLSAPTPYPKN